MVRGIAKKITSLCDFEKGLQQYTDKSPILQQLLAEKQNESVTVQAYSVGDSYLKIAWGNHDSNT